MNGAGRRRSCGALLGALLTIGCGRGASESLPGAPTFEAVATDAVHVIGTSDRISRIADVVAGRDGAIWVLNATEPFFLSMTAAGEVERAWGRRGGGPDEFRSPNVLISDPQSGEVWVYDRARHALLRVDGSTESVETLAIPRESIPPARVVSPDNLGAVPASRMWIRRTEAGFLLAVSRGGTSPFTRLWSADLIELTPDGEMSVAYALADSFGDPGTRYGAEASEFLPYPLWALCVDGSLAVYEPLSNSIRRLSGDGTFEDRVRLPPERSLEITMDRIFRMAFPFMREGAPPGQMVDSATVYAGLQSQWEGMRVRSSPVFPEYADLQCTDRGTLWLQRFDPDPGMMGRSPDWVRIARDGTMRGYRFPVSFQPLRFEATRVLGSVRDELDIESVAWMRLPGAD